MHFRRLFPIAVAIALSLATEGAEAAKPTLMFAPAGTFRIVQFTDTQDGPDTDPRTVAAMSRVLDAERPQLVIITGDCVDTGRCKDRGALEKGIAGIAGPMEERRVPWAVTFGNHDRDNLAKIGITQDEMLAIYRRYPHNINAPSPKAVYGAGNALLQIQGSSARRPAFGVWLIDSNAYAPAEWAGQKLGGYDWVRSSQVSWYVRESQAIEKRLGRKLPSLMFFHIPVIEFNEVAKSGKFEGEKNEDVGGSRLNGGLFAAAMERGDVLGMFVGHEHNNTYVGDLFGIKLGYGGSVGFATYGLPGDETARNRLRGGRVFDIKESDPRSFTTRYVTAASQ